MSSSEEPKPGLCIATFGQSIPWARIALLTNLFARHVLGSGGPGSISQLLILKELMDHLEYEQDVEEIRYIYPADHFDLFGAVGYGA
jgi:hypothetical protein